MNSTRIMITAVSALLLAGILLYSSIRVVQVDGNSMQPLKDNGDTAVVFMHLFITPPTYGDVILFKNPLDKELSIKRCLLLPGDTIKIEGKSIVIENTRYELSDYALSHLSSYNIMPTDSYFLVGDNRKVSIDSTLYGIVKRDMLIGKIIF